MGDVDDRVIRFSPLPHVFFGVVAFTTLAFVTHTVAVDEALLADGVRNSDIPLQITKARPMTQAKQAGRLRWSVEGWHWPIPQPYD